VAAAKPDAAATDHPAARRTVRGPQPRWGFWTAALLHVGGWELFCYADAPRRAHPTLSSLLDTLTAHQVGRAVAFLGWLAFGWYAVTRCPGDSRR
jgi:hypothetical protein